MKTSIFCVLSILLLAGCGTIETGDVDGEMEPVRGEAERRRAPSIKADVLTDDVCQRYDLYSDGVCDDTCEMTDPDCAAGAPTADDLEFLCELELDGRNGYCLPFCGDLDPDCADEELEETPACEESFDDNDGRCDAECYPSDEDCIAIEDTCDDEYRYADGECDTDCAFEDPDCSEDAPDTSVLESWQRETCGNLRNFGDHLIELAYSICIESRPSEMPQCAAACIASYHDNR